MRKLNVQSEFNKDVVRSRILKNIIDFWGIKSLNNIDPLVRLLSEALSNEIQKLGNEFNTSQNRILERIAGLLTPDVLLTNKPAHALVLAKPTSDADSILRTDNQFVYAKRYSGKAYGPIDSKLDVFFSVVDDIRLVNGTVDYMIHGNNAYQINKQTEKNLRFSGQREAMPQQSIWLGVSIDESVISFDGLSFYFDFPSMSNLNVGELYPLLAVTQWDLGEEIIETMNGLEYYKDTYATSEDFIRSYLLKEYESIKSIEYDIKMFYNNRFVTLRYPKGKKINEYKKYYPEIFSYIFDHQTLKAFEEKKRLWFQVHFPAAFTPEILMNMRITSNVVPVINRKLVHYIHNNRLIHNLIPLKLEKLDSFLAVENVEDSNGNIYKPFPYKSSAEATSKDGHYTICRSGMERFDSRDAKSVLLHLIDLLRDEAAAFSSIVQDDVGLMIDELYSKMLQIEQKVEQNSSKSEVDTNHYIVFSPYENAGNLLDVNYWVTNGDFANGIPFGHVLGHYTQNKSTVGSLLLMTTSIGGENQMIVDKTHAYKYALLTRQTIVTVEDIKSFFYYELKDHLKKVEVQKGVNVSPHPTEGLIKTIDVLITPAHDKLSQNEWFALLDGLKSKLISRSGPMNNYRLFFKQP